MILTNTTGMSHLKVKEHFATVCELCHRARHYSASILQEVPARWLC